MKKTFTRLLSLLLIAAMLSSVTVLAADAPTSGAAIPELATGFAEADPGQTVTLPVTLTGNPGLGAFALKIEYDETILVLEAIQRGDALTGGSLTKNEAAGTAVWTSVEGADGDGQLLLLTFRVLEDAKAGASTVTVGPKNGLPQNMVTSAVQAMVLTVTAGSVTVSGSVEPPAAPTVPALPEQPALPFSDVTKTDWFHDEVACACENGLMSGVGGNAFDPNGTLTRAMVVQILYNREGRPQSGQAAFADVASGSWYHDAVAWASARNIVNGVGNGQFAPDQPVTREQLAAILFRYAQYEGMTAVTMAEHLTGYADEDRISAYAIPAMNWAVGAGILSGRGGGKLDPTGTATRAEAAAMLTRFIKTL